MGQISAVNGIYRFTKTTALLLVLAFGLSACGGLTTGEGGSSIPPQTPEAEYYATTTSFSGDTTLVTATATFNRYLDNAGGLNAVESGLPIRYAEVHILNSSGQIIQAGETSATGAISLSIPRTAGTYTLRVNTRANNSQYKASVLQDPYSNAYYSLDTSFTITASDSSKAVTIVAAPATNASNLLGAAFNILDQIYVANAFLKTNAYNVDCPVCLNNFTVAPKVQIYWRKGITPAVYYNEPSYAISFFVSESGGGIYRGLYLLGGIEGDVCTDTDHFDRSVILHEYGHFLEDVFGKSASPGGAHDGNTVIDPRLAWSEGWADFFQAAVLGRNYYRDTRRNAGCSSGATLSFADFNLENKSGTDVPSADEGIFREISIARNLWDVMTPASTEPSPVYTVTAASDNKTAVGGFKANIGFALIWHSFTSLANSSTYKFQNMGQMNSVATGIVSTEAGYSGREPAYTNVLDYEEQASSQNLYGAKLTPQSTSSCTYNFASGAPVADDLNIYNGQAYVAYSDPLASNDFYRYDYDGNTANGLIYLRYKKTGAEATNPYDLDLYIYNEDHVLLDGGDLAGYSEGSYPETGGNATNPGYELVDLRGKSAGTYMINVKVFYQGLRATTTYFLETGSGAQLCP